MIDLVFDLLAAAVIVAAALIGAVVGWVAVRPPRMRGRGLLATTAIYAAAQTVIVATFTVTAERSIVVAALAAALVVGVIVYVRRRPLEPSVRRTWSRV